MSRILNPRNQDLADLAEAVAESAGEPPTDLGSIMKAQKIDHGSGEYGDAFDGVLEYREGSGFYIYVNTDRNGGLHTEKSRFTIGHELGHYFIDEHRKSIKSGGGKHPSICGLFDRSAPEEREADFFAANLLMPRSRVAQILDKHPSSSSIDQIHKLASTFKTSLTSAALQFVSVSPKPTAVISWNPDGSYAWMSLADELSRDDRYRYWSKPAFEHLDQLPQDSATALVLKGESDRELGATTAPYIFSNVAKGGHRDTILQEESLGLGQYGVLSIVTLPT